MPHQLICKKQKLIPIYENYIIDKIITTLKNKSRLDIDLYIVKPEEVSSLQWGQGKKERYKQREQDRLQIQSLLKLEILVMFWLDYFWYILEYFIYLYTLVFPSKTVELNL